MERFFENEDTIKERYPEVYEGISKLKHIINNDADFYNVLKKIIDLKTHENEVNDRFDEYTDFLISLAQLDFSKVFEITDNKDFFAHIAVSLNMLSEELKANTAPKSYVIDLIELIPFPAFILSEDSIICYYNDNLSKITGYCKEYLLDKNLETLFGIEIKHLEAKNLSFEADLITKEKNTLPVTITVNQSKLGEKNIQGYICIVKVREK